MKEHTRNVAVGLTVLVSLVMLGGMVLMFAGLPELLQTGRVLRMTFPNTAGAKSGEWVYMSGLQIGKITSRIDTVTVCRHRIAFKPANNDHEHIHRANIAKQPSG